MEMFAVTRQTVLNWVEEFQAYLSPTASPGTRRKRKFTYEDLEVLTLVARYKEDGATFADIHPALKNGQRGEPPIDRPAIPLNDTDPTRLQQALQFAHQKLELTTQRIEELETRLTTTQSENTQLKTQLAVTQAQRDQLTRQLDDLLQRMQDMTQQITTHYRQGYRDGLSDSDKSEEQ